MYSLQLYIYTHTHVPECIGLHRCINTYIRAYICRDQSLDDISTLGDDHTSINLDVPWSI